MVRGWATTGAVLPDGMMPCIQGGDVTDGFGPKTPGSTRVCGVRTCGALDDAGDAASVGVLDNAGDAGAVGALDDAGAAGAVGAAAAGGLAGCGSLPVEDATAALASSGPSVTKLAPP